MKEKTLLKIAVIISVVGLVVLYYMSEIIGVEEKVIDKIDSTDVEKDVKIRGIVDGVVDKEKVIILEVGQLKTINVIVFKDGNLSVKKGDIVYITGTVQEFEGKPEIIADYIKKE